MFIAQIDFKILEKHKTGKQSDAIYSVLEEISIDGRILDDSFSIFQFNSSFMSIVKIPEKDAIKNLNKQKYIFENLQKLTEVGISQPTFEILGIDDSLAESCKCKNPSAFTLFTNFLSIQSPIKCFDCGNPIPIYRIKQKDLRQLNYILGWQSEYKACDLLQMHCGFGERFGIKQMSKIDSGLSKIGLEICQEIEQLIEKPCYYYLYRTGGKSLKKERERKCPKCKGEWLLEKSVHIFDFKCDKCHLLSNISFDFR